MSTSFDLSGKKILITGASSGIGAHWGRVLSSSGATVILAARRKQNLEELCSEIVANGGKALAVPMDVSDEDSVVAAYDMAEQEVGHIDCIIANAGMNSEGNCLEMNVSSFDSLMSVNIKGVFLSAREGARRMAKHLDPKLRKGRVIIVSSITAKKVTPGIPAYSASKAAVCHLGKIMALEWARLGINVNIILPGYIETDLTAQSFETPAGKMFLQRFPRRRLLELSEMDNIVGFLCDDSSVAVTGAEFIIDEGQSL